MNAPERRATMAWANEVSRTSSRLGGPILEMHSPRELLLDWLIWCDPNGRWTDRENLSDGWEPITLGEAWQAIADMNNDVTEGRAEAC